MRRFPAVLWLLVFVGSLFVLNGAHGKWDPIELALGFGLPLVAFCLAAWIAVRPLPGRPRPRGMLWVLAGTFLVDVATAAAALVFVGVDAAVATLLAFLVPGTAVAAWIATARVNTVGPEGAEADAAKDDGDDPFPGMGLEGARPLGDSAELHDEITPHDLPKDHPGRVAAQRQSADHGTTPGHREGGAADVEAHAAAPDDALADDEAHRGARLRR